MALMIPTCMIPVINFHTIFIYRRTDGELYYHILLGAELIESIPEERFFLNIHYRHQANEHRKAGVLLSSEEH